MRISCSIPQKVFNNRPYFTSEAHRKKILGASKEVTFDTSKTRILPEGKAVQYKSRFGFDSDKALMLPFHLSAIVRTQKPVLIDLDEKNMTEAQKKLADEGKIIFEVPTGYCIQDGKLQQG